MVEMNGWSKLLKSGMFADFTIKTRRDSVQVHKSVMFASSGYFCTMLSARDTAGSRKSEVAFQDIPTSLIARMVMFCYRPSIYLLIFNQDEFHFTAVRAKHVIDEFVDAQDNYFRSTSLAIGMYRLGDRFDIPSLEKSARVEFYQAWHNERKLPQPTSDWGPPGKAITGWSYIATELVTEVYTTTSENDRGLRDVVVNTIKEHIEKRRQTTELFKPLLSLLKEVPDLAFDVATLIKGGACCPHCKSYNPMFAKTDCPCRVSRKHCKFDFHCSEFLSEHYFCYKCCKQWDK